jgi:murein DD-endopeptidase MepM/ murein hydrolase activator NlpD
MPRSRRTSTSRPLSLLALAVLASGCTRVREGVRDVVERPLTPHARYARSLERAGLEGTALGREWLAAADTVLRAAHAVTLPHREAGAYVRDEARAVGWRVALRDGERLVARVRTQGERGTLYVDAFEVEGDSVPAFTHRASATPDSATGELVLRLEAERSAAHVIRLQPELLRAGRYEVELRIEPTLAFPVPAVGPGAVQSFWGAARDGGARSHEGIDIFAPRGTPVVAAAEGTVRSTSPNRLGGNVVWLADGTRGQSLYYAHLDRVIATPGQRVGVGDTLGFVGNTGNAASTRPHLHFGIYRGGVGAVDPWPFVRPVRGEAPVVRADTTVLGARAELRRAAAVRTAPDDDAAVVGRGAARAPVRVVGAAGRWHRVQLADGTAGYVPGDATRRASTDEGR